jgi:hypothetical protein
MREIVDFFAFLALAIPSMHSFVSFLLVHPHSTVDTTRVHSFLHVKEEIPHVRWTVVLSEISAP